MRRFVAFLLSLVFAFVSCGVFFPLAVNAETTKDTFEQNGNSITYSIEGVSDISVKDTDYDKDLFDEVKHTREITGKLTTGKIKITVAQKSSANNPYCYVGVYKGLYKYLYSEYKQTNEVEVCDQKLEIELDGEPLCIEIQQYANIKDPLPEGPIKTYQSIYVVLSCDSKATAAPSGTAASTAQTSSSSSDTSAPSPTPATDRTLEVSGTVYDVTDEAMPYILVRVTPSYTTRAITPANQYGAYTCSFPLPEGQTKPFDVKIEVSLRCWLQNATEFQTKDDRTAFFLKDLSDSKGAENIIATSTVHIDPGLAQYKGAKNISLVRALNFQSVGAGYLSSDDSGVPDKFSTNISSPENLAAYSYVYHEMINALMFGVVQMGERTVILKKMPLKVELNYTDSSHFDQSQNVIRLDPASCTFTDEGRFAMLHEFGHFFEWSTNNGAFRCERDLHISQGDKNHRGFFNRYTADSYIEGFATWYAGAVQRFGLYPEPNPAVISSWANLNRDRKAWAQSGLQEEFAVAHIMYKMLDFMTIKQYWSVFKPNRNDLRSYYLAVTKESFLSGIGEYDDLKETIDSMFIACDLFKMPFGSGKYEQGEIFADSASGTKRNGKYDKGEKYWDLMYDASTGKLLKTLDKSKLVLGTPQAFNQPRDVSAQAAPTAASSASASSAASSSATDSSGSADTSISGSIYQFSNSWLSLDGASAKSVTAVRFVVKPDGDEPWAFLGAVDNSRVYLGLAGESMTGTIEASIPGGGKFWSEDLSVLKKQFDKTLGTDKALATATVKNSDLAPKGTVACPLGGSVTASGVLTIKPKTNSEAGKNAAKTPESADPFEGTSPTGAATSDDKKDTTDVSSPSVSIPVILGCIGAGIILLSLTAVAVMLIVVARGRRPSA